MNMNVSGNGTGDGARFLWTPIQNLRSVNTAAPVIGRTTREDFGVDLDAPFEQARGELLRCLEKQYLVFHLSRADGDIDEAARAAEINHAELLGLMRKHDLL